MKAVMVQGTSSGAGKTTLAAALCRIFSDMGMSVAPFKSQNMSRYSYRSEKFEISIAQALQAVAARCEIAPDMNPILLKPIDNCRSQVFVRGHSYAAMNASEYYSFAAESGLRIAQDSLDRLMGKYDLIVLEGAGSPAEINIKADIANMRMAEHAKAQVILVADIERGGSFASIAGTMSLLSREHQDMVGGFVFNKFRGDAGILKPGFDIIQEKTQKPVLGTVPMLDISLPEEDSMGSREGFSTDSLAGMDEELGMLAGKVKASLKMNIILEMIS